MISFLPVGGLLFIIEFPVEDTWEEAEEAVIVGGEGDDENWADKSDNDLSVISLILAPFSLFKVLGILNVSWPSDFPLPLNIGLFVGDRPLWSSPNFTNSGSSGRHNIFPLVELGVEDEEGLLCKEIQSDSFKIYLVFK